ncbi:uncharacterized protein Z519_12394 [Cladophialophora bantiana CBS 173.52]|uniref:Uncharacterized protein n=1 Tax=Cladophialophora bantiana (strain ATCC 10958 / CBS 173.52 / CDC B-1940 / NIH 8579) TaxID=1442370 RepID=A0A0D2HR86_CLAB1|nr:uncharacterized protein Z519_12394 [Cladophialophora bantiana CBS 173.52]KIW86929.1 hypothetical protein Z519_12394 [Cladophialophora bantiana CBS 173.52]
MSIYTPIETFSPLHSTRIATPNIPYDSNDLNDFNYISSSNIPINLTNSDNIEVLESTEKEEEDEEEEDEEKEDEEEEDEEEEDEEEEDEEEEDEEEEDEEEDSLHYNSEDSERDDDNQDWVPFTVQKLLSQYHLDGHYGCTPEKHIRLKQEHEDLVGDQAHHDLSSCFPRANFPSVLRPDHDVDQLLTPDQARADFAPSAAQWEETICGTSIDHPYPRYVCLHTHITPPTDPEISSNVDSFLGFATSLAFAREGLNVELAPQVRKNMTADVHITTTTYHEPSTQENHYELSQEDHESVRPRAIQTLLRDIPHFFAARLFGARDIEVYFLFPYIPVDGRFIGLTQHQLKRWFNRIFLPALESIAPSHILQHLPASLRQAQANSVAAQIEGRQATTTSYQSAQTIHYTL